MVVTRSSPSSSVGRAFDCQAEVRGFESLSTQGKMLRVHHIMYACVAGFTHTCNYEGPGGTISHWSSLNFSHWSSLKFIELQWTSMNFNVKKKRFYGIKEKIGCQFIEVQWSSLNFIELQWLKFIEVHWTSMNFNELHTAVKFIEVQWTSMNFSQMRQCQRLFWNIRASILGNWCHVASSVRLSTDRVVSSCLFEPITFL